MGSRFAIAIGVAAAGVMALGAQPATAVVKYDTEVTITHRRSPPHTLIYGWVQSAVRKCELGRRVVLFRHRPGADGRLGTYRSWRSRHQGVWGGEVHRAKPGWHVYAIVRHKVRDRFVCFAERSETYTVI